jgi:hypothetical protein
MVWNETPRQVQEALDILTGNMDAVCSAVPCVPGVSKTSVTVGGMSGVYLLVRTRPDEWVRAPTHTPAHTHGP